MHILFFTMLLSQIFRAGAPDGAPALFVSLFSMKRFPQHQRDQQSDTAAN